MFACFCPLATQQLRSVAAAAAAAPPAGAVGCDSTAHVLPKRANVRVVCGTVLVAVQSTKTIQVQAGEVGIKWKRADNDQLFGLARVELF